MLEPEATLVWNWHLDAICDHLSAITHGKFLELGLSNRLLINVPPGSSKSMLVSVLWQAWEWGPCGLRSLRYITTSFNDGPVKRDTRKCRDLILSEWYQKYWPEVVLTRTGETSFANTDTGVREGVPFPSLTSQRGDRLVIDDPHSTETAESDTERKATTRRFREGAINRLNDQVKSAIVVIMQRLHENDISGLILSLKMGYTHVRIPMEFEVENKCVTAFFEDPRLEDGELLDPVRFPTDAVDDLKGQMGSYGYAGQYQQRPTPRDGGLFKRHWFEGKVLKAAPETNIRWVRHWDLAGTRQGNGARTAGVKMGKWGSGKDTRFIVGHVVAAREDGKTVRSLITTTAEIDGKSVNISLPQDPGQAGKAQVQDMIAMLAGYLAHAEPETGDKYTRAEPFAAQCEAGNVYLIEGEWVMGYLDELCAFPSGALKDQVDASSGAFTRLMAVKPGLNISPEMLAKAAQFAATNGMRAR